MDRDVDSKQLRIETYSRFFIFVLLRATGQVAPIYREGDSKQRVGLHFSFVRLRFKTEIKFFIFILLGTTMQVKLLDRESNSIRNQVFIFVL